MAYAEFNVPTATWSDFWQSLQARFAMTEHEFADLPEDDRRAVLALYQQGKSVPEAASWLVAHNHW